jgi:hypothetical protein
VSETDLLLSRRQFGWTLSGLAMAPRLFGATQAMPWAAPATVKKVYLAVPQPTWPRPDLDVQAERAELEAVLSGVERKLTGVVRFTGGELVRTGDDAQAFLKGLEEADGVVIVDLTSGTGGMLRPLREIPVPVLLFGRPYSGWSYVDVARWVQSGKRADLIVTSEPGDLDPYMRVFRTIHHLRHSKVLVVSNDAGRNSTAEAFTKQFGTSFGFPSYQDLKAAYDAADPGEAWKAAEEFTRGALKVVEPKPAEITDALRLYHAVAALLEREKANAITVDCLGGFKRGDLPAYPCVAWSKLNDQGLYGVCEADLLSTMTQLLLTSFSGKPGFVSDPVFDTGRNEIIHAHCVAATAMQGIGGPRSPYAIRSHMEDNKGVSMQVMMPVRQIVTVAKFLSAEALGVSTGEVVENVDDPRGCRSKIRTRVAGAKRMLESYTGGLHRVVFYGDYVPVVEQMGRLMGFRVVHEGEGPASRT